MSLSNISLRKAQVQKIIEDNKKIAADLARDEKAYNLLYEVHIIDAEFAVVGSKEYRVQYMKKICSCPDHQYRNTVCKHIRAVLLKVKLLNELGQ